jgi:5-methylcytosine-specific restriction endonuclease McrA
MDTLVLDYSCKPIGRMSWQRAVVQWMKGKVEIIDSYEDREIKSVTFAMPMPAVVRELTSYKKRNAIKFSRENVYARDKGKCQYCEQRIERAKATYDHVVPKHQGGKTKWDNIVIACFACNQRKKNRTPEEANMHLKTKPVRPKSLPNTLRLTFTWNKNMPPSWKDWLASADYWHSELDSDE